MNEDFGVKVYTKEEIDALFEQPKFRKKSRLALLFYFLGILIFCGGLLLSAFSDPNYNSVDSQVHSAFAAMLVSVILIHCGQMCKENL